ncbi:carbonic anhydrase 2-like [Rutidosis leptorrhynchoides]|uniref:carbonic anhydrase 2-like n=1 Tax=Rutidosis leptorrhynchoides TaxID=125765 RepID=UPI003A996ED6
MSKYFKGDAAASKQVSSIGDELDKDKNYVGHKNITTLQATPQSSTFDPIERIKYGFKCFKIDEFNKHPDYYSKLAEKQEPKFLIFACSDSRVSPTNILNLRPGEAFMARNIANMVPAFNQLKQAGVGAIIEYAIVALKVEVIFVIGHSRCGGIERLLSLPNVDTSFDFIDDWVSIGQPAKAKVIAQNPCASDEELFTLIEKESVMNSLVNLLSYPYVRTGVADKKLKLMGGHYDFVNGNFQIMEVDYDIKPTIDI